MKISKPIHKIIHSEIYHHEPLVNWQKVLFNVALKQKISTWKHIKSWHFHSIEKLFEKMCWHIDFLIKKKHWWNTTPSTFGISEWNQTKGTHHSNERAVFHLFVKSGSKNMVIYGKTTVIPKPDWDKIKTPIEIQKCNAICWKNLLSILQLNFWL